MTPLPVLQRLLQRTEVEDHGHESPCWIWKGNTLKGYGQSFIGSKSLGTLRKGSVHRIGYEEMVGPIPDGLVLDHLCRVRACWNPDHLDPVTQRENLLRGGGPMPEHAAKTACIHGHPFDEGNTYVWRGSRFCRACRADRERRRRAAA